MNDNMTIFTIAKMLVKRWWIVAILTIMTTSGAYIYSEFVAEDLYASSGKFYISSVSKNVDNFTISTLTANARFGETYTELAKSDSVLEKVREKLLDSGYASISVSSLRSMLKFSALEETEVWEVRATSRDPYVARAVVSAMLDVAPQEIKKIVKGGGAEIVDKATLPTTPTYPNVKKNTVVGFALGFIIGAVIAFLLEFFDLRIKPEDRLEEIYSIPVIGNIPESKNLV